MSHYTSSPFDPDRIQDRQRYRERLRESAAERSHFDSHFDYDGDDDAKIETAPHPVPLVLLPEGSGSHWRKLAANFAAIMVLTVRFTATSFIMVLGAPLFLFLMIAGWNVTLLLTAAADLAAHYQDAEPLYQIAFAKDTLAIFIVAVVLVTLLRLPRFLREVSQLLDRTGDL
jgi:hypothetical protein